METFMDRIYEFAATYGLKVVGAIVILIIGRIAASLVRKGVRRALERTKTDPSIVSFVASFCYVIVLTFVVIVVLGQFGVQTASMVAVLGAVGFAVGFALQGSLSNFAAGVMVLVFRPYRVGDFIDAAGIAGTVKEIKLFNTILATPDNIKVVIPNGKVYGDIIKNITGYDTRRVDMSVGIGYTSSIQQTYDIISAILRADERVLDDPPVQIAVSELADSSVNFVVRPWVRREHYWGVFFDFQRKVKEELDAAGIEIPFPQQTVHLMQESTTK
jgi:small conductance mechanosensitive channel